MVIEGKYEASNWFLKRGIILSLKDGCYKTVQRLLGVFKWESSCNRLPEANYILLFRTFYVKCETCSVDDFESGKGSVVQLALVYGKNRRLVVHESNSIDEVKQMAFAMAREMGLKIRDSATNRRNPVWLLPNN